MEVQERNSTRIYSLSSGPSLPEWLGERARRNLSKRDSNIRRRIELLQDFGMPSTSSLLRSSPDGRYLLAAGTYSPRIRCYELSELSMKFERYTDAEVVDAVFLGPDYGKMALLLGDRHVAFHAPYGHHAEIRIPTFGRAMAYEPTTCELLVACSGRKGRSGGGEVYRINLEEGRFSAPLGYSATRDGERSGNGGGYAAVGGSCIAVSPTHALTALGGDDGIVRFWDNRVESNNLNPFCTLDVQSSSAGYGYSDHDQGYSADNPGEVTSLSFDSAGMHFAAGTRGGIVALYDVRSSKPLFVKEHQYGMPIHTVRFHSSSGTILSADAKLVKVWRSKPSLTPSTFEPALDSDLDQAPSSSSSMGAIVANIEGTANFNHFISAGDEKDPSGNSTGLILCAGEQPKMQAFYCPALGPAPRWCSFLDGITEELEEKDLVTAEGGDDADALATTNPSGIDAIYQDYKFLTRSEIDALGIQKLVGTSLLRGYMHGFFIDIGLYNRIRAVANPFEYEDYRKKKIREKMEEKRASRIAPRTDQKKKKKKDNSVVVNAELAERLEGKTGKNGKESKLAQSMLTDDRFGSLFQNPDFQIDEEDINFKLRNPSGVAAKRAKVDDDMDSDKSDADDDDDDPVVPGGGFTRVDDDDDDEGWGRNDDNDDDDNDDHYSDQQSSDSDEDGFRGGKVRGENYQDIKKLERVDRIKQKKQKEVKKKKKEKKAKNVMYEADDYGGSDARNDHALGIGLGDRAANAVAKRRREEMTLPLEERLRMQREKNQITGETKRLRVKGEGSTKEVTYIPKDARKKIDETQEGQRQDEDGHNRRNGRKRRGVKDLGFKTPFKNKI